MELKLVDAEDVRPDVQSQGENINPGVAVTEELRDTLDGIYSLTVAALESEGYKSFTCLHPKLGRDVTLFVKGGIVIMSDYHGVNVNAGILPETEAKSFIEDLKEVFGEDELAE